MADERDVIDQADALMRRHRSFVARPAEAAVSPAPTFAEDEADLPLLTEIVDPAQSAPPSLDELIAALQQDIDAALSTWLVEALPSAVTNASQHILAELDAKARHTLLPQLQDLLAAHRDALHPPAHDPE